MAMHIGCHWASNDMMTYCFRHCQTFFVFCLCTYGFDDFVEKIEEMGLSDLIVKKDHYLASIRKEKVSTPTVAKDDSTDWWYLG